MSTGATKSTAPTSQIGRKTRHARSPRTLEWRVARPSPAPDCEAACCETIRRGILRDPQLQLRLLRELADDYARLGEHERANAIAKEVASLDRDMG